MTGVELQGERDTVAGPAGAPASIWLLASRFPFLIAAVSARHRALHLAALLALSLSGFLVMGYHPGAEDDGVYLAAIKSDIHPALYPHDAELFKLQLRASLFDKLIADSVRMTGVPLEWAEFVWQLLAIALLIAACWQLIVQLAEDPCARYGAIVLFSSLLTLPVAGTALYIADQYLHPRTIASAFIIFAISRILAGSRWQAMPLIGMACAVHPLMGAYGASLCCVLTLPPTRICALFRKPLEADFRARSASLIACAIPLDWLFHESPPTVMNILRSRHWYCLYDWTCYEWLGVLGPFVFFWLVLRTARKRGSMKLARFSFAILMYGAIHQALAMVLLIPGVDLGLGALEPMRYLHLVYVSMALIAGALLGRIVLQTHILRWTVLFAIANGGMLYVQRQIFPGTEHLELPWSSSSDPWLQAFNWIRLNTPQNAYFVLDPNYLALPQEDYHGFRALAERSALCDSIKDASVVTKAPELAARWQAEVNAQKGWSRFDDGAFERLKSSFGVNWVVLATPPPSGLICRWHREGLSVCEIP